MIERLELDGRKSGIHDYRLLYCVGREALTLVDREGDNVRLVDVPMDRGNDAMIHPEAYLAVKDVIVVTGVGELFDDK